MGFTQAEFDELSPPQQQEVIQDWVWGIEIESDLEHNPIVQKCAELEAALSNHTTSIHYLTYPDSKKVISLAQRHAKVEEAILQGACVTVTDGSGQEATATVMLPNFQTMGMMSSFTLAEEIAHLMAMDLFKAKKGKT